MEQDLLDLLDQLGWVEEPKEATRKKKGEKGEGGARETPQRGTCALCGPKWNERVFRIPVTETFKECWRKHMSPFCPFDGFMYVCSTCREGLGKGVTGLGM